MDDSMLVVVLVAAAGGGVLLWRWLGDVRGRASARIARAADGLERAIRADERRRAEARFARLLDSLPPAPPPRVEVPRQRLDDRLPWEK